MTPLRIPYGGDENQFFELWQPEQQVIGFAIFIHGGFWRAKYDLHHADEFCAALADRGMTVANLEYRRVGQPGGGWPGTFEDVVNGVRAAITYVGKMPVLIGHSAGAQLALCVANEPIPLKAVAAFAPVSDLRLAHKLDLSNGAVAEFLGGSPDSLVTRYDEACPSRKVLRVPTVLVHGTADEDVPVEISRSFVQRKASDPEPPKLVELPGAGHMEVIDPNAQAGKTVIDLVVRLTQQ